MKAKRFTGAKRSAVLTLLSLAAFIVLNLILAKQVGFMDVDLSRTNVYQISDTTRRFTAALDTPVEITVIGTEPDKRITKFVSKYAALSDGITWRHADPLVEPEILARYGTAEDTVAVFCADTGRTKLIPFSDIIQYDLLKYAYYGEYEETCFDGDSQLTNAINYVLSDGKAVAWCLNGHGETDLPKAVKTEMEKTRFALEKHNLLTEGGIGDAELLILNAPARDISADEADMLADYVAAGGNVILLLGSDDGTALPNLAGLTEKFGMIIGSGIVEDEGSYYQNSFLVFPELDTGSPITRYVAATDAKCLVYQARCIELPEEFDAYEVQSLMRTTSTAVTTTGAQGNLTLAAITTTAAGGTFTLLPASMIENTLISNYSNLGNVSIFMNAATSGLDEIEAFTIPAASLASTHNATENSSVYGLVFIALIPAAVICFGLGRWLLRKYR